MYSEIKSKHIRLGAILLLVGLLAVNLPAVRLEQKLDAPDSLFLGSRFYLNISSDVELKDVTIPDTLSSFAVMKTEPLEIKRQPDGLKLTIAALDTGVHTFPSLRVNPVQPINDTLLTELFTLEILATRAPQDTTLADIAPTQKLKGELPYWVYYLIAAFLLIAVLILLILLIRKFRRKIAVEQAAETVQPDNRPNWKKALDALQDLKAEQLPAKGEYIIYYFRLSEIMKLFLEAEYKFSANEMTTREIRQHLNKHKVIPANEQKDVHTWLESCDKVKFAKHVPTLQDCDDAVDWLALWLGHKGSAGGQQDREQDNA
ncbi:MAG: hypothetical protein R6V77_07440 [Candidatus Cloacimonadaceae bacterium]